jgi:glycine/sarcosine N-methyltransferase
MNDDTSSDFLATEIARFAQREKNPSAPQETRDNSILPDPFARLEELVDGISELPGQRDLGAALLDRHLASLKKDFAPLMAGDPVTAPYDHVESIVALFYSTLTDSYIGIDSHLPSDFWEVHPFLLDHLEDSLRQSPSSTACHGRRIVRILRRTMGDLEKDEERNGAAFRKYMAWHDENNVLLLRVDPGSVTRKQKKYKPTIWTTDIGLWPRTCALLFEPKISASERMKLQLYLRYDPHRFNEVTAYVKQVIEGAQELFLDGGKRLRQRPLPDSDREDLNWSLDAIFEPGLAGEWKDFVDPETRLNNKEGEALVDLLEREIERKGIEKKELKIFDAAMGVGSESVYLLQRNFDVVSNEVDWTLISHARRYAEEKEVKLNFDRYDWRHLAQKVEHEKYDVVLCLGNSLTCLLKTKEMLRALNGFNAILKPGGLLVIDERNYRDMLLRDAEMLGEEFFFPGSVIYCGEIKATLLEIFGPNETALLGYYDGDRLVGKFMVYCYGDGEFKGLLEKAGFQVNETFWDFTEVEQSQAEFVTYIARRPDERRAFSREDQKDGTSLSA